MKRIEHRKSLTSLVGKNRTTATMGKAPISHSITSVDTALSEDLSSRQTRYFVSMMIRTGCFIATIFLPSPWRWLTLAGSMLLPYVAVVIANAGREPNTQYSEPFNLRELPPSL